MIGMSIKRISVLNFCHVLKPFVKSTPGLWQKLLQYNINGKCFNVIRSLYANIKSKVMTDNDSSAYFPCMNGSRQGKEHKEPGSLSGYFGLRFSENSKFLN